jgi:hypothetical protein
VVEKYSDDLTICIESGSLKGVRFWPYGCDFFKFPERGYLCNELRNYFTACVNNGYKVYFISSKPKSRVKLTERDMLWIYSESSGFFSKEELFKIRSELVINKIVIPEFVPFEYSFSRSIKFFKTNQYNDFVFIDNLRSSEF